MPKDRASHAAAPHPAGRGRALPEPNDLETAIGAAGQDLEEPQCACIFANIANLCITDGRIADRAQAGKPVEDQVVLIFTDGHENASSRYDRAQIFDLVKKRQDDDCTFVFMGSNQDSYGEGSKVGFAAGNVQNYPATAQGT